MNNSYFTIEAMHEEQPVDVVPMLRARLDEIAKVLSAIDAVKGSAYWVVLEEEIFTKQLNLLQRRLRSEKDTTELFRLQGAVSELENFGDLKKLSGKLRKEVENINKQIKEYGKRNSED